MKITIKDGTLTASPENQADLDLLLGLHRGSVTVKNGRKHKKHIFLKKCPTCGKACKGKRGIKMHQLYAHEGRHWKAQRKARATGFTPLPGSDTRSESVL